MPRITRLKHLFVSVIANIKQLSVGTVNAPGQGNINVENDATVGENLHVGGDLHAENVASASYMHVENDLSVQGRMKPIRHRAQSKFENPYYPGRGTSVDNPDGFAGQWPLPRSVSQFPSAGNGNQSPKPHLNAGGGWIHLADDIELQWGSFECNTDSTVGIRYRGEWVQKQPGGAAGTYGYAEQLRLRKSYHDFPHETLAVFCDLTGRIGNIHRPTGGDPPHDWWNNPAPSSPEVYEHTAGDSVFLKPLSRYGFTYNRLNEWQGSLIVNYVALGW